jgi:SAM-dependent methyltransferase
MSVPTCCPICETYGNSTIVYPASIDQESFSVEVFSARRMPDRRHYQWVRCNKCLLLRSDPVFDLDLEKLYVSSTFDYSMEVEGLSRTYFELLEKACDGNVQGKSLLEIGGGNGFVLEVALAGGFQRVAGVEPSIEAISAARADIKPRMIASIMKENLVPEGSFDVVAMFHTLDHLPDPVDTLKLAYKSLKVGGVMVVAIHNEGSWSAKLLRERSPIIDVEHTHLYSKKTAELIFTKSGFLNVTSGSYKNYYSLAYLIHLIPIPASVKRFILKSWFGALMHRLKTRVGLGNMYVIGSKMARPPFRGTGLL